MPRFALGGSAEPGGVELSATGARFGFLLYAFSELVRALKSRVADYCVGVLDASGKYCAGVACPGEAVYPPLEAGFDAMGYGGVFFCGGCEEVDVGEAVFGVVVDSDGAVEQGFHLAAHFIEVDRRGECYHVGLLDGLDYRGRVVGLGAASLRGAAVAAEAGEYREAAQRNELHLVSGGFRAVGEFLPEGRGVAAFAFACGYYEYFFHGVGVCGFIPRSCRSGRMLAPLPSRRACG